MSVTALTILACEWFQNSITKVSLSGDAGYILDDLSRRFYMQEVLTSSLQSSFGMRSCKVSRTLSGVCLNSSKIFSSFGVSAERRYNCAS